MILVKTSAWCIIKCITEEMTLCLVDQGLLDHFKMVERRYISSPLLHFRAVMSDPDPQFHIQI